MFSIYTYVYMVYIIHVYIYFEDKRSITIIKYNYSKISDQLGSIHQY